MKVKCLTFFWQLLGTGTILTLAFPMLFDFVGETSLYQDHWFFYGLAYWKMWWYLFLIDPDVVYCVSYVGIIHESLILVWSCILENMTDLFLINPDIVYCISYVGIIQESLVSFKTFFQPLIGLKHAKIAITGIKWRCK